MAGDPFGLLLRQRIIFMGNEVTDFSADAIVSQLLLLDSQDPTKDIKLFINSPGGSVTAGEWARMSKGGRARPVREERRWIRPPPKRLLPWFAGMGIYDAMKMCRADIQTVCFGLAASMGAFILGAGTKGKRFSMPNSRIMIHQPLGGASGAAVDIEIQVSALPCCHTSWPPIPAFPTRSSRSNGPSAPPVERRPVRSCTTRPT